MIVLQNHIAVIIAFGLWLYPSLTLAIDPFEELLEKPLTVCVDYHCGETQQVSLDKQEWAELLRPLQIPAGSAREERERIAVAIARLETLVGQHAGTAGDLPENSGEAVRGQLDCIAESTNTERYLTALARAGVLHWHQLQPRMKRSRVLLDVHWTAVIREKASQKDYAVDSWFHANGERPIIQPLRDWLRFEPATNHASL